MNAYEKTLLWSGNLWLFSDGLLGPLFAIFTEEVGGDILDITYAWATFLVVTGILTIHVGKLADRIGHEKLLITGYGLNALFTFAYLLIDSPLDLLFVQAGLGFSLALANPTWYALYDKHSGNGKDGYIWGSTLGQGSIATGIATLMGGMIVTATSFSTLFIIMGVLQISATLVQAHMFLIKKPPIPLSHS